MRAILTMIVPLLAGLTFGGPARAAEPYPLTVTDIAGRTVTIGQPPERVILGTGRTIYALDLLFEDDLFDQIVAWRGDLIRNDNNTYELYRKRFEKVATLPEIGQVNRGEFDAEYAIQLDADLLVLDLDHYSVARQSGLMGTLAAAGTKTVFIDFRNDPLRNTPLSIALLGEIFDRSGPAAAYNAFYERHLARLRAAAEKLEMRRSVFIERAAGINGLDQCCRTWGRANLGLIAEAAGLENVGSRLLPGASGYISMEKVLIENPDLYVMSGANWGVLRPDARNVPLGYGIAEDEAQAAFGPLLARPGFAVLDATRDARVYALFHQFVFSPLNIISALYLAKWAYPELHPDLDPAAEFAALHDRFLTADYKGTFGLHYRQPESQ